MDGDVSMKIKKYDIVILIVSIFLQNFALIKTHEFGIAFSTCFLVYLFFKYQLYKKVTFYFVKVMALLFSFLLLGSVINDAFNLNQILRLFMIIFDAWSVFSFVKLFSNDDKKYFVNFISLMLIVWCGYGLYQYIAQNLHLPQFLNIFSNNPSYGVRGLYHGYSGWSSTARIYTTFFEPSVYAIFLVYVYSFIFLNTKSDDKSNKLFIILTILMVLNLIFTFARSGYITVVYIIFIYFITKIFKTNKKILNLTKVFIISMPIITFLLMLFIGIIMFDDLSMKMRTYSSIYYLRESVSSFVKILVGHGIGTLSGATNNIVYNGVLIENFAHNGYIEIVYQFGYVFIGIAIQTLCVFIDKMSANKKWIVYGCIFTVFISGALYNVESIVILLSIICAFSLKREKVNQS